VTADQNSTAQAAAGEAQQVASVAADRGKQVAGSAADQAQNVLGTARSQVSQVTTQASAQINTVVGDAFGRLHDQAAEQTDKAGRAMTGLAGQMHAMAEGHPEDAGPVADVARRAADRLERVAARVQDGGFDGLVADTKRYARRRPVAFLAGAVTAGFVVGSVVAAGRASGALSASVSPTNDGASPALEPSDTRSTYAADTVPPSEIPELSGTVSTLPGTSAADIVAPPPGPPGILRTGVSE
jgi:hypothetical protein